MIYLNSLCLKLRTNSNIKNIRSYLDLYYLLKTLPFIVLCLGTFATAATNDILKPFGQGNKITQPNEFRQQWIQNYQNTPNFGLLNPYPLQTGRVKRIVAIDYIRSYGAEKAKIENKESKESWASFVPKKGINGVSTRLAAVDFLTRTVPLLQPLENKEQKPQRINVVKSMEDLLTLKSTSVRKANTAERKVIIGATVRIALERYNQARAQDKRQFSSVAYWKGYLSGQHEGLANHENIRDTINTRATLAALAIFEINRQSTLNDILTESGMKPHIFINFINEIKGVVNIPRDSYDLATDLTPKVEEKVKPRIAPHSVNHKAPPLLTTPLRLPKKFFEIIKSRVSFKNSENKNLTTEQPSPLLKVKKPNYGSLSDNETYSEDEQNYLAKWSYSEVFSDEIRLQIRENEPEDRRNCCKRFAQDYCSIL